MKATVTVFLLSSVWLTVSSAQVYDLRTLNTHQISALDRERSVVFLTLGVFEEHGPYMPAYTDGFAAERHTRDIANALVEDPGWNVVLFPPIPLGSNAANEIGEKHSFPGSYTVRPSTLRAALMDLADQLGQDGFRWIFVIYPHGGSGGATRSSRAIDQACDYFHDIYGGVMVNLLKIRDAKSLPESRSKRTAELLRKQRFCPHACGSEFSRSLYLHPELVDPGYRTARSFPVKDWGDAHRVARRDDWQGYFGSPQDGDAVVGAELFRLKNERLTALARKILAGRDPRSFERYSERFAESRETAAIDKAAEAYEQEAADRQRDWLRLNAMR